MSDIRFNQWLHQSGTGGITQVDGGHVGIGTTNPDIAVHSANTNKLNVGIITANSVYSGAFHGDGSNLTGISAGVSLTNGANNRVVTATGANAITGETTLTFDGSTLAVTGLQNAYLSDNILKFDRAGYSYIDQYNDAGSLVFRVTTSYVNALRLDSSAQAIFGGTLYIPDTIAHDGDTDTKIRFPAANIITAETAGSERFRIESNGNVSMGIPDGGSSSALHIRSTTSTETTLELSTQDNYSGSLPSAKISFTQQNGTEIARIKCDTNTGAANMADLTFWTNFGGLYERLRITKNGQILTNGNTSLPTGSTSGFGFATDQLWFSYTGSSANYIQRFYNGNGLVGSIFVSGSSTQFNTGSDYRLKENAVAISNSIERLKNLKPYRFNFKSDPSKTLDGFFAHEAQSVVPESVTGVKDEVELEDNVDTNAKKGDPIYQSIDQSKLVPLLTAALQDAVIKIETLEAKVETLEERVSKIGPSFGATP